MIEVCLFSFIFLLNIVFLCDSRELKFSWQKLQLFYLIAKGRDPRLSGLSLFLYQFIFLLNSAFRLLFGYFCIVCCLATRLDFAVIYTPRLVIWTFWLFV